MMIGADVTHPPPRNGEVPPSIAVAVASIDGTHSRFKPAIRLQEGRVYVAHRCFEGRSADPSSEMIQDLAGMMKTFLETFRGNTKALPAKIIVFRDGVSEGQYAHCAQ